MTNFLRQYYYGITQQLRAEVDFINTLFQHPGVKGDGNESALRQLITKFIPKRYGVGTGIVIDRHGTASRQCDIVIYDTYLYPSLLSMSSVHLFPVDLVYATIEVKTTLTSDTAREALENIASVRGLGFIETQFGDHWSSGEGSESQFSIGMQTTTPPLGFVFGYNSNIKQAETFKTWFTPTPEHDIRLFPSLVGCLDIGTVSFVADTPELGPQFVHPAIGSRADCKTFPVIINKDVTSLEDLRFLTGDSHSASVTYAGNTYPVKKVQDTYLAIDQSRVLLAFLLSLPDFLANKKIHPTISFLNAYSHPLDILAISVL